MFYLKKRFFSVAILGIFLSLHLKMNVMNRQRKTRYALIAVLLFFSFNGLYASSTFYYFKQFGIREGLSQSKVQSILNDHKGYLWIGTESGLNCYDRDCLKHFFHHDGDEASLPSNDILFVAEDSLWNLWVATVNGICLYDRMNECFHPVVYENNPIYISSYLLLEDGILFGGTGALYKYEYKSRRLVKLTVPEVESSSSFLHMLLYDSDHVLINTRWYGVYLYDLQTASLKKLDYLSERNYPCLFIDSDGYLWASSYGNGLFCYKDGKEVKHFSTSNSPLTYDVIHDMVEKDNQLWLATDGGGINIISLDDYSFTHLQHVPDDIHSFPADALYRLYKDEQHNMWVGSIRNGLIGVKEVDARSFRSVPFGNTHGLSSQSVNSFFQDREGTVWIGTDGEGINSFDPVSGLFKHYASTRKEKVVSIIEYSDHELLFFSFNKGFFIFDKGTGHIRPFILMNEKINEETCVNGYSVNIQKIAEDKILFSAQNILVYDRTNQTFDIVATKDEDYLRNSPLIIGTVGTKTYLADLNNICEYDVENNSFKTIYKSNYTITDACMDKDGVFWLATTVGLVSYDIRTRKDQWIQTNLFPEITSIIADKQNRIWIGTRHSLSVYFVQTHTFSMLGEVDGILPNEYIFHATLCARDGKVYLGGTLGMTVINPSISFETESNLSIELLDVILNGLPVMMDESRGQSDQMIEIPWNFSSLQLKVLLNEKDIFRENLFRFEIQGSRQELTKSGSNSLTVNYLPVGEYQIVASYYTKSGEWSQYQKILHVIVSPPWWETNSAYLIYGLIILSILYGCFYLFNRKKRMEQQREIEKIKSKVYEDKINFLTNISHELRTPLTLICAPLKRIINKEVAPLDINRQLALVYKQASQMKGIINMVLDVRKLEEGKEVLHISTCPLNTWLREVGANFADEFVAKGIQLVYELDERIKNVSFDKNKCEFVLSNFLMNAFKFSEGGTIVKISSIMNLEENTVRVSVADQGIGLNVADMNFLFSNFYQGAHDKGGSGIGLAYCKSLISHHGGRIAATNNPDKGATFYYELPMKYVKEQNQVPLVQCAVEDTVAGEGAMATGDYSYLKSFSLLVVEDIDELRGYLCETLTPYFARVYVAKDGKEGLEMIKHRQPDIIVSDVMMPHMNGFELCKAVKMNLEISHIPFILLTAYSNTQNIQIGYKTGADVFLAKPFEVDVLLSLINNQLKLRESIRARCKESNVLISQEVSFSNADETFLLKLNALIMDNINNQEMDVAFLAKNMCISRSLLFSKIKAVTDMGIIDYVNKLRIDKAAILLNTTTLSITEISEMVGFSSSRYFSKVFKQLKGEIPSAFRKQ